MKEDLDSQRRFLRKTLVPTAVAGGGLCGLVASVVVVQTLGPLVVVAGSAVAGAATYQWLRNRQPPDKED